MLTKFNILSVNQMNAQIKLTEMWKSINIKKYPIKTVLLNSQVDGMNTRSRNVGLLKEEKTTYRSQKTFTNDAIHIWNKIPVTIKTVCLFTVQKKRN